MDEVSAAFEDAVVRLFMGVSYSSMTANEAGATSGGMFTKSGGEYLQPVDPFEPHPDALTPSKPWTDARFDDPDFEHGIRKPCNEADSGDHCFCVRVETVSGAGCLSCCWCQLREEVAHARQRVPGHGPHRTELVRE